MKKKLVIAAVIACLAAALLAALFLYRMKTRNAVEELSEGKKIINILIAGSNKYKERKFDFFAVLSINPVNGNIGITFIPPSFKISMGGSDIKRIDEVDFIYFEKLRRSIYRDVQIQVPFYVQLYATDGERITDMLEGIDLFYLDQYACADFSKQGLNYFDGKKIMKYINNVEENSIYLKYDRIMDILLTLYYNREEKKKFLTPDFLLKLLNSLQTNLLPQELLTLSRFLSNEGELIYSILPGDLQDNYYVMDDVTSKMYTKEFLEKLVSGADEESGAKIKILNATPIAGLARKTRNMLNRDGYNVVEFGTSPYGEMKKSFIVSRKGDQAFVKKISELSGIPTIYYIIDNSLLYNTLIMIGKDLGTDDGGQEQD
ncbi:MAG: LytR C-terminal domain-containing protein [Leptospirales bacterium]|nr:LytR C-terminal domain-containing protein [Leptospirales bacterium]